MDNRPIGIFDSGLGGLTAVKEMASLLPEERIVYFGDTGRVPYGTRSRETIEKYTAQDIAFLLKMDVKAILAACGTASSVGLLCGAFRDGTGYPVKVMGVVESAAAAAVRMSRNGVIGVLGTGATIRHGAYERAIKAINPAVSVVNQACPLFVPLVENGYFQANNEMARLAAAEYLEGVKTAGADTVILGCTHYPLMADVISGELGDGVTLIDSGREAAKSLAVYLKEENLLADGRVAAGGTPVKHRYYVSDCVDGFGRYAKMFMGHGIDGSVERVEIGS